MVIIVEFPTPLLIPVSSAAPSITSEASSVVSNSMAPIPTNHISPEAHHHPGGHSPLLKHKEYQVMGMLEYQPHDEARFIKSIITGEYIQNYTQEVFIRDFK